jgi:hypothetical protein
MYTVSKDGSIIEDATYFIQSPTFLNKQQIREFIRKEEKHTTETIALWNEIEIGEQMFKALGGNTDNYCFKIV